MTNRRRIYIRLTQGLLPAATGLAFAISGMTHDAPALYPDDVPDTFDFNSVPLNLPTWPSHGDLFEGTDCRAKTSPNEFADTLAVITQGADPIAMDFDTAWEMTHNDNKADDIWIIGVCA